MALLRSDDELDAWLDGLRGEWVVGTVEQAAERLSAYEEAGASRIRLQHQLDDDLEMVAVIGELV